MLAMMATGVPKGRSSYGTVDSLAELLTLVVASANEQDRAQVDELAGLHFQAFACLVLHRFIHLTLSLYEVRDSVDITWGYHVLTAGGSTLDLTCRCPFLLPASKGNVGHLGI